MSVPITVTRRHLLELARKRLKRIDEHKATGRATAGRIAHLLARDFGAGAVWLWGSLARDRAHERSDIDLVVEGLDPERLSAAADELAELEQGWGAVDLLRFEAMPESWRASVLAHGERLV